MTPAVNDWRDLSPDERKQVRMYGCTKQEILDAMDDPLVKMTGLKMYVMSILSDAQEILTHNNEDDREEVRQLLNFAKFVLKRLPNDMNLPS